MYFCVSAFIGVTLLSSVSSVAMQSDDLIQRLQSGNIAGLGAGQTYGVEDPVVRNKAMRLFIENYNSLNQDKWLSPIENAGYHWGIDEQSNTSVMVVPVMCHRKLLAWNTLKEVAINTGCGAIIGVLGASMLSQDGLENAAPSMIAGGVVCGLSILKPTKMTVVVPLKITVKETMFLSSMIEALHIANPLPKSGSSSSTE